MNKIETQKTTQKNPKIQKLVVREDKQDCQNCSPTHQRIEDENPN